VDYYIRKSAKFTIHRESTSFERPVKSPIKEHWSQDMKRGMDS